MAGTRDAHPRWCDPQECTAYSGGVHCCTPYDLAGAGSVTGLSAYLTIEQRPGDVPYLLLSVLRLEDADGESGVLRLTGRQGIQLGSALRRLGVVAEQAAHATGAT